MASPLTKVQQRPLSTQIEPSIKAKSTITSRMRENEGKFIRQLEQKDQEIIELKRRLNEIAEKRVIQLKKRQLRPLRRPSQRLVMERTYKLSLNLFIYLFIRYVRNYYTYINGKCLFLVKKLCKYLIFLFFDICGVWE